MCTGGLLPRHPLLKVRLKPVKEDSEDDDEEEPEEQMKPGSPKKKDKPQKKNLKNGKRVLITQRLFWFPAVYRLSCMPLAKRSFAAV